MKIIEQAINAICKQLGYPEAKFGVEHPKDEAHGDYSCNIAMALGKQLGKNPREVAGEIVDRLQVDSSARLHDVVEKIEIAGPGFINFYLKEEYLLATISEITTKGDTFGQNQELKGKKVIVEYTDPNPFKEFHIGHLMSNTIGEAIARLKVAEGATVKRANYQGDVGLHVAKAIYGMLSQINNNQTTINKMKEMGLVERQRMMGQAYAYGATEYETNETAKLEINALNKVIYDGSDPVIKELYTLGRAWSLEYFETIYSRLGTKFDEYFFESEAGPVGLKVIEEGLAKGVLEIGEGGAVVYKGEKVGLHTRVFRNALGLPTYEGKELGLAKTKFERFPYDLSYIITANEITEYFRVLLSAMSLLYPELAAKTTHIAHGIMKLKSGKMSSRTGKVVSGEGLLDELKEVVLSKMGDRDVADKAKVADQIAVAALKYTVLKQAIGGDIVYEPESMTNLEGDTGPYVQYAYARICSILRKSAAQRNSENSEGQITQISQISREPAEIAILKWLYRYPEVVATAAAQYSPHLICTYLNELAGRFNGFYATCRIGDAPEEVREQRLILSTAVAQVLKNGLNLLGIAAPEEM